MLLLSVLQEPKSTSGRLLRVEDEPCDESFTVLKLGPELLVFCNNLCLLRCILKKSLF